MMNIYSGIILFFMVLSFPAWGQSPDVAPLPETSKEQTIPMFLPQKLMPELERPTIRGEPTEVQVSLYIIDVDEVDSAEQNFAASVFIEARWYIPELRHEGSGPINLSWTEVWTPRLVIVNQQQGWRSFPESVEVLPDGQVIYRQKTWGRFSQPFDLRNFPLDIQKLTIQYAAAGLSETEVKMVPLMENGQPSSGIAKRFSLPDFEVLSWKASPMPYRPNDEKVGIAGFQMEIEVERRVTYFVVKIILPLCLIVIMSWLPLWTDPRHIGSNLAISATSFLTLVAYLFAITVLLPRVSYLTRMDQFIILSTVMVFACMAQTVAMSNMVKRGRDKSLRKFLKWSRAVYPVLLVLLVAYSFFL
jgi:hypothetical protein